MADVFGVFVAPMAQQAIERHLPQQRIGIGFLARRDIGFARRALTDPTRTGAPERLKILVAA